MHLHSGLYIVNDVYLSSRVFENRVVFSRVTCFELPIALSKASVCCRSPAEIVGSNPTGGMDVCLCCECCVLSGRGLCDELITRPEESYRLWCVVVCDLGNVKNGGVMTRVGSQRYKKKVFN